MKTSVLVSLFSFAVLASMSAWCKDLASGVWRFEPKVPDIEETDILVSQAKSGRFQNAISSNHKKEIIVGIERKEKILIFLENAHPGRSFQRRYFAVIKEDDKRLSLGPGLLDKQNPPKIIADPNAKEIATLTKIEP